MNGPPGDRPLASISLDLDNLWSYMKIHGESGWKSFPTYLDKLTSVAAGCLSKHGLKITVFVVGQDAALEKNREALTRIASEGHEIGNHSFSHEPWFQKYSYDRAYREISEAEEHIERLTGKRPLGYRGPGFSFSRDSLEILAQRGYSYDASTFPTFIGPLARTYYFWTASGLSQREREERKELYGALRDGLRSIRPYLWDLPDGKELLEIPVTTMPVVRLPFHMSYLLYLAGFSKIACKGYLQSALLLCRACRVQPSFLLHPLDFLGCDLVDELSFFPGMSTPTDCKLALFDHVIATLGRYFRLVTMDEFARSVRESTSLRTVRP